MKDTHTPTQDSTAPDLAETAPDTRIDAIWKRAYSARTPADLKKLYADWAESYDADHEKVGFFGHKLTAEVLARYLTRHDVARILDAGAGTGAAGEALHALGFRDMTALDLSAEMLEVARKKQIYRRTLVADLSMPIDAFAQDRFDAAVMVGVFSYGQAPKEALNEVLRLVRPGGVIALTMRTDFHRDNAMGVRGRMEELEEAGAWRMLERTDPAQYLPQKDPDAMFQVFCYRVTGRAQREVEPGFEEAVEQALASDDWVKKIDHAWIWDSMASSLYERYTRTSGYYLTDCEEEILHENATAILGDARMIVELGCGSARKISHVLAAAIERDREPVHYLPIDVSAGALSATEGEVRQRFSNHVRVEPRQGMFDQILPELPIDRPKLVFFFGSSLGNLDTVHDTVKFLRMLGERLGPDDRFVAGIDLHKDEAVLERAYNEETACRDFFVHMLRRINVHLGADFDPRVFELSSTYDEEPGEPGLRTRRMNLRIAPRTSQRSWVRKLGIEVHLEAGQPVQVGISRKYEPEGIRELARMAGLELRRQWFDRRRWFSLNEFVRARGSSSRA